MYDRQKLDQLRQSLETWEQNSLHKMLANMPDREFAEWAKAKKLRWIGVDCGSADHPMNTIVRDWMPRQAREAEIFFQKKFGKSLTEFFDG